MPNLSVSSRRQAVYEVFTGRKTRYQYLREIDAGTDMAINMKIGADRNFDYDMLLRQFAPPEDRILIVPVRFHERTLRLITPRHGLGSVIYQRDIGAIMKDLKELGIGFLSVMPINYRDYDPVYSPLFDDKFFSRYCRFLFSYKGCKFYKFIYDGSNLEVAPSPVNVAGLPVVLMEGHPGAL